MEKVNEEHDKYDIVLNVDIIYDTFNDFYNENKYNIYKKFIELFRIMSKSKKQKFTICINWNIKDATINTEYQYDKSCIDVLNEVLLPYFLELEEYETCGEIKKLYDKLNNG